MNYLKKIKAAKDRKEMAQAICDYWDDGEQSLNCSSCPVYNPQNMGCIYSPSCFPEVLTRLLTSADDKEAGKEEEKALTLFEKIKSANDFELALLLTYDSNLFNPEDYPEEERSVFDEVYYSLGQKAPSFSLSELKKKIVEEHNTFRPATKSNADLNDYLRLVFNNTREERQKSGSEKQIIFWNGVLSALSMISAYINNQSAAYNQSAENKEEPRLWDKVSRNSEEDLDD